MSVEQSDVPSNPRPQASNNGPIRVLELRSVFGTGGGPEKTILLGTARTDPSAVDITVCYLRAGRDEAYRLDERARELGVNYVEITERHSFDPGIWKQLDRLTKETRVQIVHSHEYKTDVLAWLLGRRLGPIPLATAHGWTGASRRERLLYYPVDKRVLRRFPRVIAVSSEIKEELVRNGADPGRIQVILNGIDHQAFRRDVQRIGAARERFGLRPEAIGIGAVGRLEPQKRFDVLLESFARVRAVSPDVRLLIAGEGSQRTALERLRDSLHLGESCALLGQVDDVGAFHHAIDLLVQSSDYEGTPNAVLEAMAFETPVVATRAGGTEELIVDGVEGLLVARGDVPGLTAAILEVIANRQTAMDRARAGRRKIESDLSFETRMRKVEGVYRDLVNLRSPEQPAF